ncbi:YeeE/YedE family protein [Sinorhizobium meliloti]|uniref:YeeE/YedE family protein n=1 Tax=Rhizobium meliloti TaxID=382 RepID=UPI001F3F3F3F|nr:YeeE/YedE family protein [Sinorhizobium meliloti]
MTDISFDRSRYLPSAVVDRGPALVAGGALLIGLLVIAQLIDLRQAALFVVGGLLGVALYHGSFGFTGGWRRMVVERRGRGIRAQMLMIGVAALAMIPLISAGSLGGQPLVGALIGSAHLPWWLTLPSFGTIDLGRQLGTGTAILATLAGLGLVALATALIERRAHGNIEREPEPSRPGWTWLLYGPWPLVGAGLLMALLNVATLLLAGHPWSVTFGFGLWGAKAAQAVGVPVATWEFWNWPGPQAALSASVLADVTSVMNFGIVLGAAAAASLAGKFAPKAKIPLGSMLAAVVGGLLMGYGARLSFGCNIGALFSGIASGSLHGWLWFATAFVGSFVGIWMRPLFGLDGFKKK